MLRLCDLRQKEVINVRDGSRFGFISDVVIDVNNGKIIKLVVPGAGKVFGFFGREEEIFIPWCRIVKIGDDIILVDVETEQVIKTFDYS